MTDNEKHLGLYQNKTDFDSKKSELTKPWVALTEDDGKVYYKGNPPKGYVDLGLPSGKLWAKCNLGATKPEEYGKYFQWGDTVGYTDTSHSTWKTSPFNNGSSSYDSAYFTAHKSEWLDGDVLKPEYDAVYQATGGKAHMPTNDDWKELTANTTVTWETNFNNSGINGRKFASKKEGYTDKYIFIPAAGYANGGRLNDQGSSGSVWSSSLVTSSPASSWNLYVNSDYVYLGLGARCFGFSVRGVID